MSVEWSAGHFIAGDLALDFANTVFRRRPELGADLLTDAEAFGAWLVHADLPFDGRVSEAAVEQARALRATLWTVFDAQTGGRTIPAEPFARLLETGRGSTGLVVRADGSMTATDTAGALAILALRAVMLLLDPPSPGVRACDRCGWFFLDSSRGRRRRWCSMQTCGNQAKAERHRAAGR
ncbi:ABATE domain-containing protein [Nocardia sp. NPDC048505]|uniref:CGNR zinc finger domain-containing protein n=1 Tax=unclassified Nocardia TaxID=2637762 RepID=UPI0033DFD397